MTNPTDLSKFIEWDVRNWSGALDFWLAHSKQRLSGCLALEIGSRHGGLSSWLASQGAEVICSDLNGPTEKAVEQHRASGLSNLIDYESIDATQIPYTEQFDVVVFKSVLGGIGSRGGEAWQAQAIKEMHKALKKGGELFFAENLVASPLHQVLRRKFVRWGESWRYISMHELQWFLTPFSVVQLQTMGFAGAFGRSELQRDWFGWLDRLVFDRIVPENWKYIVTGVARK
ncbi:MAG: class I SAM-dependent methyltransferase [Acidobacteria bacterium]|nr:MAG: class I SAM-dependent methyltransferase [Acidobacteriota bacterium]